MSTKERRHKPLVIDGLYDRPLRAVPVPRTSPIRRRRSMYRTRDEYAQKAPGYIVPLSLIFTGKRYDVARLLATIGYMVTLGQTIIEMTNGMAMVNLLMAYSFRAQMNRDGWVVEHTPETVVERRRFGIRMNLNCTFFPEDDLV